jgi:hypothetical protein
MKGEAKRHWTELCERAAINERDPKKLMKLIAENNNASGRERNAAEESHRFQRIASTQSISKAD